MNSSDPGSGGGPEFGPLDVADVDGVSALIRAMSNDGDGLRLRDKSPAYYRWMYLDNPAGPAVVWSARQDGEVVASFAVAPKRFVVDGREVLLGKTMDMFTHPDHQGRGLMGRCTSEVFAAARERGIEGWYVTPSVNSYPIFTGRWGYDEPLRLVYRARVLGWADVLGAVSPVAGRIGGLLDRLPRRRREPGQRLERVQRFGPEADDLWQRVSPGFRVAAVRDAAYLNWRYLDNPDDYTCLALRTGDALRGVVVTTTTRRRGVMCGEVMDVVCAVDDDDTFDVLIRAAVTELAAAGCALVQAWSVHGTAMDGRIRRAGLRMRRTDVKFLTSPGVPAALREPEAWLLAQGDGNDV